MPGPSFHAIICRFVPYYQINDAEIIRPETLERPSNTVECILVFPLTKWMLFELGRPRYILSHIMKISRKPTPCVVPK